MFKRLAGVAMAALAACTATQSAIGPAVVPPLPALAPSEEVTRESMLALNAICSAEAIDNSDVMKNLRFAGGMGTGGFKVDSDIKEAQDWFDYGLALSHAFYHDDAKGAMKRAVTLDPSCSLCAWGEAWVLGPTLNYGVFGADKEKALEAARRAKNLAKPGDAKALALADALIARYDGGNEPDFGKALAKIAAEYPDELELTVLAAHSLLIPVRAGDEQGLRPALALLEDVLRKRPDDTGAIHYYIHGTEFDDRPEDAIRYAERLGLLAPAASHLVHMPAHTFFQAGRYQEAAVVNAQAIEADTLWVRAGGSTASPAFSSGNGARLPMYYSHNLAFGLAGALMSGDGKLALKYAAHAVRMYPQGTAERGNPVPRSWVALARHAPDEMLALQVDNRTDTRSQLYRAYGRGEALLMKGDAAGARAELANLRKVTDSAERSVAEGVLAGRIAMAEGKAREAADLFLSAAGRQESDLSTFMDPPTWWYPVRRSAAAAFLKAGDHVRAEKEAAESLRKWKHDPLALWVLGKAQLALGRTAEGEGSLAKARSLWRGAFDSITVDAI